ncbi:TRPT1 [Symbiodinium microadriaticum]|nr:TRPT1 [Symbiodinium microadriaticum]
MQMQHTLFGVCVIQIKPQLEKVLNLPPDSLTKEIALTEDLMELFIDYQIPTDLLSSESAAAAGGQIDSGGDSSKTIQESGVAAGAIAEVKANVAAIQSMISRAKEKELEEKKMADEMLNKLQKQKVFQYTAEYGASVDAADVADSGSGRILRSAPMFMAEESFSSQQSTVPSSAPVAATSTSFQSAAQDEAESMSSSPSQPLQYSNSTYDVGSARTKWYDVTSLPASLQEKFEVHLQKNSIVRPSIITAGVTWTLRSYANLFAEARSKEIGNDQQRSEKLKVYGLLDALTKSGALEIDGATVHVIVASAHIFDDNVMDTIVQSNVNPIEKMEWSSLVMASVVHDTPVEELVQGAEIMERVQSHFHLSPIVNEV